MIEAQEFETIITSDYDCEAEGIIMTGKLPHCKDDTVELLIENMIPEQFEYGQTYTATTRNACQACGMKICATVIFGEENGKYLVTGSLTKVS